MEVKPITDIKPSELRSFNCGIDELNTYLKRFARKNDKLGIGKTYLLVEKNSLIGFYTISMSHIEFASFPEKSRKKLPKYPIPAARIGRLAVDLNAQGSGFGEYLLMDALARCQRTSNEIAIFAVIVDAKNDQAKKFYLRYGFIPFKDHNLSLFLPMSTFRQS